MSRRNLFFIFLFFIILATPNSKVCAYDGEQYIDSNGVVYQEYGEGYTVTGYNGASKEVIIPEVVNGKVVNAIGNSAFRNNTSIISIDLPETITSIGEAAFGFCHSLKSINIPEGVTSIGDYAWSNCDSLTSVAIPESVTSIGDWAFWGCSSLKNITMSGSVTSIGDGVFTGCSNVTIITIPEGVTSIGESAFSGCSSLTSITIPEGVTSIGESVFSGCSSLTSINIPGGVKSIGYCVFAGCSSLTSINIPGDVTSISDWAFVGCSSLTSIAIPERVTSIGSYVFAGCSSLTSINIPGGVKSIGDHAWSNCDSLTSISIPETVTSIGDYAFFGCHSLKSITILGITSIGNYAFSWCSSLTGVTIPCGVTSIADNAFFGCDSLKILGYTNSYADTYATKKGYQFECLGDAYDQIFTVKFNTNCETAISDVMLNFGSLITDIPNLVKEGWELEGWYKDSTFSIPYNIDSDKINSDMTLFAKWIANVNFDTQGGTTIESLQVTTWGKILQPNNPTKTGYTFGGWYKEANCINMWDFSTDEVIKNTTLYAKWTKNVHTVNFNSQGGSLVQSKNAEYGTLVTAPTEPTKKGYTFSGWYKDANCTLPWDFEKHLVKYDITLYAKWVPNKYNIIFDSKGGTSVIDKSTDYNTTITAPSAPAKIGYTFGGWYKEVECLNPWRFATDKVTEDTTLYAKWIANKHSVSFNSQGGSAVSSKNTDYNSTITAPAVPMKTGYIFGGWYKEAGCLNAWNFASDKVTEDTILYAKWTVNKYTIKFNNQIGNVTVKTADYNTSITEPSAPTRTNYKFNGWYTASNGGTKVVFPYIVKNNITLYAQWTATSLNNPTGLTAKPLSYNSAKLTWRAVSEASGYEVYRSTSITGKYTLLTSTTNLNYTNTGLTTNSTYYYKVRAYKIVGTTKVYSGYTAVVSAKPILSMPTNLIAKSLNYNSAKLTWSAASGASGYEVYRSTSSTGTYTLLTRTTSLSYINTGLTTNKTYYYKVRAYKTIGTTKVYSGYTTIVSTKPILSLPTNLVVKRVSSASTKLTWGAASGASGYEVYRSTSSTGTYTLLTRTTSLSYTNKGLTTNKTYYYKIRTYKTIGTTKVYSGYTTVVVVK